MFRCKTASFVDQDSVYDYTMRPQGFVTPEIRYIDLTFTFRHI